MGDFAEMALEWVKKFNVKLLAIGHIVFHTLDYAFDYVLYPFAIYKYGLVFGYIIMTFLSAAVCLMISAIYDWLKKDWLGIEAVKEIVDEFFSELKEEARESWRRKGKKLLSHIFHRNIVGQFIFLSIKFDPLITTIYMRRGYHRYNGFSVRDWKIFWGSTMVSNVWWAMISFAGVSLIMDLINKF